MNEMKWDNGTPSKIGLYFVAVEYGDAAGAFDFFEWNGDKWDLQTPGNIIGHIDLDNFKRQLNVKWPGKDKVKYTRKDLSGGGDLWEEV